MNAVVTLCIGNAYEEIAKVSHPTIEAYAKKIGAAFEVITERKLTKDQEPIGYEKYQLLGLLDKYERIIFIDTDVIVRPDCPNLFRFVPEKWVGAFNEGDFLNRKGAIATVSRELGIGIHKENEWGERYYNTGVLVIDRFHRNLLELPRKLVNHFYEQTYFNLVLNRRFPWEFIKNIGCQFNRMSHMDEATQEDRLESFIVHYAGTLSGAGYAGLIPPGYGLVDLMKADLAEWDRRSKLPSGYDVPKKIKVSVGGGLGDQIDAEPVVREIRRLYPHDHLIVASHWPEIFEDLDYKIEEIVNIRKHLNPPDLFAVFHTYAGPDTEVWKYMTHVMMESTNFSSLHTIRRQLPPEKKDIQIRYRPDHKEALVRKLSEAGRDLNWLQNAVVLHPGRSWATKTVSTETWNALTRKLLAAGRNVVLIGKDAKYDGPKRGADTIGLTPVEVPEGVVDFRDKLPLKETLALLDHAKVLVSNDSGPVHLAGATDIWIIGVFTAKHPAFILPFRKLSQYYKTIAVNGRPKCWPCNVNAVTTKPSEVRADHCLNYDEPLVCHPSADDLAQAIDKAFRLDGEGKLMQAGWYLDCTEE